jgi:hypothetical protein
MTEWVYLHGAPARDAIKMISPAINSIGFPGLLDIAIHHSALLRDVPKPVYLTKNERLL